LETVANGAIVCYCVCAKVALIDGVILEATCFHSDHLILPCLQCFNTLR